MKFHEKLKQERKKLNLSQEDLANKINISRQSISKWELEKGYPNIETLIELSELFDITVDELLKGDDFLKRLHYADWNEVRITLTVKDIADVLNVCDTVALNLVRSGEIPAKKVAGQWRILKTDLMAYLGAKENLYA